MRADGEDEPPAIRSPLLSRAAHLLLVVVCLFGLWDWVRGERDLFPRPLPWQQRCSSSTSAFEAAS